MASHKQQEHKVHASHHAYTHHAYGRHVNVGGAGVVVPVVVLAPVLQVHAVLVVLCAQETCWVCSY